MVQNVRPSIKEFVNFPWESFEGLNKSSRSPRNGFAARASRLDKTAKLRKLLMGLLNCFISVIGKEFLGPFPRDEAYRRKLFLFSNKLNPDLKYVPYVPVRV